VLIVFRNEFEIEHNDRNGRTELVRSKIDEFRLCLIDLFIAAYVPEYGYRARALIVDRYSGRGDLYGEFRPVFSGQSTRRRSMYPAFLFP